MTFDQKGFQIVRNIISPQLLLHLKTEFEILKEVSFYRSKDKFAFDCKDKFAFGDRQVPLSFSMYAPQCFESLSKILLNQISEIVSKNLVPTYTFGRFYYEGAILHPHRDRDSCEYSATVCIDSTDLWDFFIEDHQKNINAVKLNPGDMCVYSGCEVKHWREEYKGDQQIQCFLHYVDSDGDNKDHMYDKRPMMGIDTKVQKLISKHDLEYS